MPLDFDAAASLADLRLRVLNGEPVTAAEYRNLILDLQRGRDSAAAAASAASRRKVAKVATAPSAPLDLTHLFGGSQ